MQLCIIIIVIIIVIPESVFYGVVVLNSVHDVYFFCFILTEEWTNGLALHTNLTRTHETSGGYLESFFTPSSHYKKH